MQNLSLTVLHTATDELTESLTLWLDALMARGASPRTVSNYRESVGRFIAYLHTQSITTFDAVKPRHIRQWLIDRREAGVSPETLHNAYRNPRAWWNFCMREGLTRHNPFAQVEKPHTPAKLKPALAPEQVQRLLDACEGQSWLMLRDRALLLLLIDTGLRIHEAHALTVGDAKQESLIIRGKGGKQRAVFLSPEVRLALKRYLRACPHHLTDASPLWQGVKGALTLDGLKNAIKAVGERAGITPLGAHAFRRTFATWSLRNGIDLEHLRLLMGHSDYRVLRQYLALVEADLKRAHQQHSPLQNLRLKGVKK